MIEFIGLVFLLPIFLFMLREDGLNLSFLTSKKFFSGIAIILLLIPPFGFSFEPAFAESYVQSVIVIEDEFDADNSFQDYVIHPPLQNTSKAFVFMSFSHAGEADHSDTFRSWELVDDSTLRVFGEDTATGNIASEFIAYVVEFRGDINVQHLFRDTPSGEGSGEKSVTIPTAINTTNSFILSKGHHHNASETSIGAEELDRLRIIDSTSWGWLVFTPPNSGDQGNAVDIVDFNDDDIRVQRGLTTLSDGSASTSISPSSDIDRERSILLVTYACGTGCGFDEASDDIMLRATIDTSSPPDIDITRVGTEDDIQISWTIIEDLSGTKLKVHHDEVTLTGGTTTTSETVPEVRGFDKSIAISTVGTPFGWSTGSSSSTVDGAIDRGMVDVQLTNEDEVSFERADSTGTTIIGYQVISFLEEEFPENAQGTNFLKQIVKLDGTFTAGNIFQDYTISPPLDNPDKTMVFLTMNSTFKDGSSENGKLWQVINSTTFRIIGSGTATNDGAEFQAQFVEFNGTSPIFVQFDQIQFPEDLSDSTRGMWMSPVNTSNAFILGQGSVMEDGDPTFGQEEFAMVTLVNETRWEFETQIAQDSVETVYRPMIVDFNQDGFLVQRGTETMQSNTTMLTVVPPTSIDRNSTLILTNFRTVNGTFGEFPNRTSLSTTINTSNEIEIERSVGGIDLEIAWQTITAPADFWNVQHGIHHQDQGQFNETSTINTIDNVTNAFGIGTVASYYSISMGRGNSSEANNFDTVYGMMEIEDPNTLRFTRGDSSGSWDMGFQVVEWFFTEAGSERSFNVTDSVVLVDNFNSNLTTSQNFTDTVTILDVFNSELANAVDLSDIINITDNFISALSTSQNMTDGIVLTDNFTAGLMLEQDLLDTITILDTFNATVSGNLTMAEVITILDVFNATLTFVQDMPDSITITDVFTATLGADYTAIDTITILDAFLATCATCTTGTPPPTGNPNPPFGGGGGASSTTPFGQGQLVNLQLEDIDITVAPGEIIDLSAFYTWDVESQIHIIEFEPQRDRWFSVNLPVIEEFTTEDPNSGEIPFAFRLPVNTCQTQGQFDAQNCYESPFIQFPITVSGVADGRVSSDTATVTIRVQSGIEVPLIYYIVSGVVFMTFLIAWLIVYGRTRHDEEGDRIIERKHTKKEHTEKEKRLRQKRKQSRKEGTLTRRLNSRPDNRRTQRQGIVRKKKVRG